MQCLEYPVLSIDIHGLYSKFLRDVYLLANALSRNVIDDWSEIQNKLKIIVEEKCPDLLELGTQISKIIESEWGFVVIKGLPFHLYKRPIADYLYLSLAASIGQFTVHSNAKNVIWEVTPRSSFNNRKPTFSELNSKAPLHIDSAFRYKPEEYFGLFAINSAREGGNSIIIRADQLIQSLQESSSGAQCLEILSNQNFPFEVPPAFVSEDKPNVILAPIVADAPLIRFRLDTIEAGFKHCPELVTPDRLWALKYFNEFTNSYQNRFEFKLDDGDIVFVNNHKVLHGRTAFTGSDRLLLRIRIDRNSQDAQTEQYLNQKIGVVA